MATLQHTDELYHILEDEICALKILPGEALSENQLCKRFGVSRTPIRSVLQRLEQNRFVQIIPCKGTIVTAIDTGVVDQLIFQRVAVGFRASGGRHLVDGISKHGCRLSGFGRAADSGVSLHGEEM